ncbi:saccharopine dehydrogenase-like oxidoreductase [Pieris brassicae]|uniref:saccharopine dehydrogenase-like oxidoreductase n=1 Tax=Pieris brassicae TaxID=7116 RepID=UPI001E660C7B|nr:saccharopine dehydrogenase-like oxidoreductase [Pieris brassicae]
MSRLDLVIFGATGFTGKHAVMEMSRQLKQYPLSLGVAGRSQSKLEDVLKEASQKTGNDLSGVKIIVADVGDEKSLKDMCSQAKVLVNCCGPYRHYGEPVVKAAVECKSHYVDVSGEPQFIETMQLKYGEAAREAGVYVISACGFDSIPTDLGVVFLEKKFEGTVNSVESYLSSEAKGSVTSGVINYGTWESLVYGITHLDELPNLRKKIYPEKLPEFKPKLKSRSVIHQRLSGWCLPFPGSDASIVYRTQRTLLERDGKRPVQIKTYVKFTSFLTTLAVAFSSVMLFILTRLSFTRDLLLKHPRLFTMGAVTREGPSEEVMNSTVFSFLLLGEGWSQGSDLTSPPNKKLAVKVSGVNPGYGATVVALLFSALTILNEKDKMPKEGGVLTTGVAFRDTSIIQQLHENNLKFEIVNDEFK